RVGAPVVTGCRQHHRHGRHVHHSAAAVRRHRALPPTGPAGAECGTEAVPLLTIASSEWDGGSATWIAEEDRPTPGPPPLGARDGDFTLIDITGGNNLQLHVCPSSPHHPHFELLQ
ncbi:hypothetical protein ACNFR6_28460, partial [Streptomyces sp. ECR3]